MLLTTLATDGRKVRSVNCTDSSFDALAARATRPSGDEGTATGQAVINCRRDAGDAVSNNAFLIFPYGVGADNTTFDMRVYGWKKVTVDGNNETATWFSFLLASFSCTLSAYTGRTNGCITASERFVDTITLVGGNDDVSVDIVSPANDTPAHALLDFKGAADIEVTFDMTGATSGNAVYSQM